MGKIAKKYLEIDPNKIIEKGFHKERSEVSESLFSLSNEYMGIRGFFDEGISEINSLRGSYFNGIYDLAKSFEKSGYKGVVNRTHFMVNSVDYFKIELLADGEKLDLNKINFSDFYRELDFSSGLYTRFFNWKTKQNKTISIKIERFLSLVDCHNAFQKITLKSDSETNIKLSFILCNDSIQWKDQSYFQVIENNLNELYSLNETLYTKQKVISKMEVVSPFKENERKSVGKDIYLTYEFNLKDEETEFIRFVTNLTSREYGLDNNGLISSVEKENNRVVTLGYDHYLSENIKFFKNVYEHSDIEIKGSPIDQQGIRYCIFMLNTTYHGYSPFNNIGAKGLTGEAYSGHAFWDSETYCLPYYLFNNIKAAKNLILFRYNTLKEAKLRAKELDCKGACFPIATLNGNEACTLWQHASLQFQPSSAVVYAIFHYYNLTKDKDFLLKYGYELTLEVALFLLSRGQYNNDNTKFGFYSVMGPDEFKMMVNNNAYTNIMAKFVFDYVKFIQSELAESKESLKEIERKVGIESNFFDEIQEASEKMDLKYDKKSKLFEQNDDFFKLPHIDIHKIPQSDFPLYSHWSYDRIYRGDMIKQPDVLMFIFLFLSYFPKDIIKANYEYYEPRCIHESSLSPSIHSIIANEIDKKEEAINFFGFASRLDLDDYNNNTKEGLHLTSVAAAWVNILYGFAKFRSDGKIISLAPTLPDRWDEYTFRFTLNDSLIKVVVSKEKVTLTNNGSSKVIKLYGNMIELKDRYEVKFN